MPALRAEYDIATLMGMMSRGELKLPEVKRGYKWTAHQVSDLIESFYRGYPTGSLILWKSTAVPSRAFAIDCDLAHPISEPLYLVDGEQRLTAIYRVLHNHPDARIVFNVDKETFQPQSLTTLEDPHWINVYDILHSDAHYNMVDELHPMMNAVNKSEIAQRLHRIATIPSRGCHIEVLTNVSYSEILRICQLINNGGRPLPTSDLMVATLATHWPGIIEKLEMEANYWKSNGYDDIDITFLTQALTAVVHGELSAWSRQSLEAASSGELEQGWQTVQRGLRHLISLLKNNLKISHSSLLPSKILLLPLIVFLGERPDEPLEPETAKSILYWLLVATIRKRYTSVTDAKIGQDIEVVRQTSPEWGLHNNLGTIGRQVEITTKALYRCSVHSPYGLLSFLTVQANGAHDWWYGVEVGMGGDADQRLEGHHIHPQATLGGRAEAYSKSEINELANLAFISGRANRKISDRSPADYFLTIPETELEAHFIPLDENLRHPIAYRDFLTKRRRLLAKGMTEFLNNRRPDWLDAASVSTSPPSGSLLKFTLYLTEWDSGRILAEARHKSRQWVGLVSVPDIIWLLDALAEEPDEDFAEELDEGIKLSIGGQNVLVQVDGDKLQIPFGPFLVIGTISDWRQVLDRAQVNAQPLSKLPAVTTERWEGDRIPFPVTRAD